MRVLGFRVLRLRVLGFKALECRAGAQERLLEAFFKGFSEPYEKQGRPELEPFWGPCWKRPSTPKCQVQEDPNTTTIIPYRHFYGEGGRALGILAFK